MAQSPPHHAALRGSSLSHIVAIMQVLQLSSALRAPCASRHCLRHRSSLSVRAVAAPVEEVLEKNSQGFKGDVPAGLNKYSGHITQPKSQGASQAMLYATGLTEADMGKPQVRAGWGRKSGRASAEVVGLATHAAADRVHAFVSASCIRHPIVEMPAIRAASPPKPLPPAPPLGCSA